MSKFTPPFYYSHDDLHNEPYISGPWTEKELWSHCIPDDVDDEFKEDIMDMGYAEWEGERYELHSAETMENEIKEQLEMIRKMRAGEKIP